MKTKQRKAVENDLNDLIGDYSFEYTDEDSKLANVTTKDLETFVRSNLFQPQELAMLLIRTSLNEDMFPTTLDPEFWETYDGQRDLQKEVDNIIEDPEIEFTEEEKADNIKNDKEDKEVFRKDDIENREMIQAYARKVIPELAKDRKIILDNTFKLNNIALKWEESIGINDDNEKVFEFYDKRFDEIFTFTDTSYDLIHNKIEDLDKKDSQFTLKFLDKIHLPIISNTQIFSMIKAMMTNTFNYKKYITEKNGTVFGFTKINMKSDPSIPKELNDSAVNFINAISKYKELMKKAKKKRVLSTHQSKFILDIINLSFKNFQNLKEISNKLIIKIENNYFIEKKENPRTIEIRDGKYKKLIINLEKVFYESIAIIYCTFFLDEFLYTITSEELTDPFKDITNTSNDKDWANYFKNGIKIKEFNAIYSTKMLFNIATGMNPAIAKPYEEHTIDLYIKNLDDDKVISDKIDLHLSKGSEFNKKFIVSFLKYINKLFINSGDSNAEKGEGQSK